MRTFSFSETCHRSRGDCGSHDFVKDGFQPVEMSRERHLGGHTSGAGT
jgi:hypothetical protein